VTSVLELVTIVVLAVGAGLVAAGLVGGLVGAGVGLVAAGGVLGLASVLLAVFSTASRGPGVRRR